MILCDCYLPHDTHDIHVASYNNNISLVTMYRWRSYTMNNGMWLVLRQERMMSFLLWGGGKMALLTEAYTL